MSLNILISIISLLFYFDLEEVSFDKIQSKIIQFSKNEIFSETFFFLKRKLYYNFTVSKAKITIVILEHKTEICDNTKYA